MAILTAKANINQSPSSLGSSSELAAQKASRPNATTIESIRSNPSSVETSEVPKRYADPRAQLQLELSRKGSQLSDYVGRSLKATFANSKLPSAA